MRTRFSLAFLLLVPCAPSLAQAQYFGKNKVQYKDFDWRVLETPHFEILFYEREAEVARDAARMAERAYAHLAGTLNHEFARKIPLILYASHSDFQQTNITPSMIDIGTGGITELVRRRVFLPFTGSYGEFEHVLTHELVHAFEVDILFDPGQGDPLNPFAYTPPLWVMEGLAEYLSRDKNDAHTDMWLRDASLSGYLLPLDQLAYARDIRVYRFGQSIFEYFASQYGTRKIGDLLRAMRDNRSLDQALQAVVELSLAEFSEAWMMAVRREQLPRLAEHQVAREFAEALVTRKSEEASMLLVPSISPDGTRVAYVSDAGITRDLYVRDVGDDGGARRLVQGDTNGDFESLRFFSAGSAWSPDGRVLAFAAKTGGEDALYLLDVETSRVLARHGFGLDEVQTPSFSPDGEEILFVGIARGQSNLYRVRRDGTDLRQITHDGFAVRDPQWSPDGARVVYVTDEGPGTDLDELEFGRFRLMLLDLDSGARRDVTPFETGKAVSPAWSGDGESIAFVSDRDGISNIYLLHLPTGQVFRLTDSVTGISGILPSSPALSWARETNRLVFSAFSQAGWDIYGIDDPCSVMRPVQLEPGRIEARLENAAPQGASADDRLAEVGSGPGEGQSGEATPAAGSGVTSDAGHRIMPVAREDAEAAEFVERRYEVRLAPDLSNVGGVVGYDTGIGGTSQIHFSDLLGNHNLSVGFGIYGSLKDSDLSISYLNRARRTNYMLSAFQFKRRYGFLDQSEVDVEEQTFRGVRGVALRPFDKFSRLEVSLQVAGVGGRFFLGQTQGEAEADSRIDEVRYFVSPGLAYIVDTAIFGSTGPILGRRMRLSLEFGVGQLDFATLETDVRQYWNLNRRHAFAVRAFLGTSSGSTPQTFYLGGSHTLRGYDYGALVGNHVALVSTEFRFPLLRHVALGWPLPLELTNIRGVLFVDGASAWDDEPFHTSRAIAGERPGRGPQISYGFGTRLNLGAFVLKLDWAQRYDTDTGDTSPGTSVSLGADF
ncbi:MAG: BamA/TamA family outer membrane protein [Candidatus Krumholzibacteriia bacterium]